MQTPLTTAPASPGGGGGCERDDNDGGAPPPPYRRFLLGEDRPLPRTWPSPQPQLLHQEVTDDEVWEDFRSGLEPLLEEIVKEEERDFGLSKLLSVSAVITVMALAVVAIVGFEGDLDAFDLAWLFACFFLFPASVSFLFFRQIGLGKLANLEKLKNFFSDKEPGFASSGYAIECRLQGLWLTRNNGESSSSGIFKGGYYLYLYPTTQLGSDSNCAVGSIQNSTATTDAFHNSPVAQYRNGYLRVEIAGERATGGTKLPSILPASSSTSGGVGGCNDDNDAHHTMPPGMESISPTDWTGFWTRIDNNSDAFVSCSRKFSLALTIYLLYVLLVPGPHSISFLLIVIAPWMYYVHRMPNPDAELESIVNEYTETFRRQGVYMEYCKLTTFHRFYGGYPRRYIYLFPFFDNNKNAATTPRNI